MAVAGVWGAHAANSGRWWIRSARRRIRRSAVWASAPGSCSPREWGPGGSPQAQRPIGVEVLLLVRHGETAANARGHLLGRADVPLSATGLTQAAALARWLPPADLVVSSPLQRARQTAAALGLPVRVDERWIERDYGPYDDRPPSAITAEMWARWRAKDSFAPPGVEPDAAVAGRVRDACADLLGPATSSTVVVVSHVSPIKAAIEWALGVSDVLAWRLFVEDAGVSRIDVGADGPVVRWFNRCGG